MKKTTMNGYYEKVQKELDDWDLAKTEGLPTCTLCGRELLYQEEIANGMCTYCTEDTIDKYKAE